MNCLPGWKKCLLKGGGSGREVEVGLYIFDYLSLEMLASFISNKSLLFYYSLASSALRHRTQPFPSQIIIWFANASSTKRCIHNLKKQIGLCTKWKSAFL